MNGRIARIGVIVLIAALIFLVYLLISMSKTGYKESNQPRTFSTKEFNDALQNLSVTGESKLSEKEEMEALKKLTAPE